MAKYSTGGGSGDDGGGACELCGAEADTLTDASVAGASLAVCRDCAPHDDRGPASGGNDTGSGRPDAGRRAAQNTAKMADAGSNDPDYWVEHGTDYEGDQLPYLVSGYGDLVRDARQDAGHTIDEFADVLGIPTESLEAVEQGRATRAGVGGSVIEGIEEELGLQLSDA